MHSLDPHSNRWPAASLALVVSLLLASAGRLVAAPLAGVLPNAGFEEAALGWSLWPDGSGTAVTIDTTVARTGKQSLHLQARASDDRMFPNAPATGLTPGGIYRVTCYVRRGLSVAREAVTVHWNIRTAGPAPVSQRLLPMMPEWQAEGDWERWAGIFQLPANADTVQFCLGLQEAVGEVWIDDLGIAEARGDAALAPSVWRTLSIGVEIGGAPQRRYNAHKAANGVVYQISSHYNRLMFRQAFAEDALRQAERHCRHAGQPVPAALAESLAAMEKALEGAYDAYVAAFASGQDADWAACGDRLGLLEQRCAAAEAAAAQSTPAPLPAGELPPHLGRQDRAVPAFSPAGRLNRLLFGVWGPLEFSEQEAPYEFEFHSAVAGSPADGSREAPDFGFIKETCDRLESAGYRGSFGYLMFGIHDRMYAPEWLLAGHPGEPGLHRVSWDGLVAATTSGREQCLDYFHPGVQGFIDTYLAQYAAACRDEPRVLFHETSQEAYPDFKTASGAMRQSGYGPHALAAFHAWLGEQYGDVAALNQAWGTTYAAFTAVAPPPDAYAQPDRPRDALTAEFERFRENAYIDYLARLYRALKRGDASRPVAARHSALLRQINGARIFETCDVLSCHSRAPQMGLMTAYANSLARLEGKSLGYLEDFWGVQEQGHRPWDERAQRAGLQAHVQRQCIWGQVLQMKWYAYTSGAYLFTYNGNWFDPRYDVTTLRYCAPGLAVAKRAMERFDWMLTHSQVAPARVLLLQPSVAMRLSLPSRPSYSAIMDCYRLFNENGVHVEILPEEVVLDGRVSLADFAVVCLPEASFLQPSLQQGLADHVLGGGAVVAVGEPGRHDHLARPAGQFLAAIRTALPAAAQADLDQAWSTAAADAPRRFTAGRGEFWAFPGSRSMLLPGAREALLASVKTRAAEPAWSHEGRFEVVLRQAEDGGRYACVLNPDAEAAREDLICLRQAPAAVVDLGITGGARVPLTAVDGQPAVRLRLYPGEGTVLWLR